MDKEFSIPRMIHDWRVKRTVAFEQFAELIELLKSQAANQDELLKTIDTLYNLMCGMANANTGRYIVNGMDEDDKKRRSGSE